jgi:chromate transport protein ChrA
MALAAHPNFAEVTALFARIDLRSYAGPACQLALMHVG